MDQPSEDDMVEGDLGDGTKSVAEVRRSRNRSKGDFPDLPPQAKPSKRGSSGGSFSWTPCSSMYMAFRKELEAERISQWRIRDSGRSGQTSKPWFGWYKWRKKKSSWSKWIHDVNVNTCPGNYPTTWSWTRRDGVRPVPTYCNPVDFGVFVPGQKALLWSRAVSQFLTKHQTFPCKTRHRKVLWL